MKKLIFSVLLFAFCFKANAQFENILAAGEDDLSKYIENYTNPLFKGVIQNLNGGWYQSKVHKKLGFDITINASISMVSDNDKSFIFKNDDYQVLGLASGNSAELPTLMGVNTTEQIELRIPVDSNNNQILYDHINSLGIPVDENNIPIPAFEGYLVADTFDAPNGIEEDIKDASPIVGVPTPMVQFGLGLPKKTTIKLRFIPNIGNKDVKTNLIGIGLQHNLLQHFFKLDKVPVFDLSILGAFTSSTTNYKPTNSTIAGSNQETEIKINAYTLQLVGNANFKIVNFYAGIGYASGNATFKVKGNYEFDFNKLDQFGNFLSNESITVTNPISTKFKVDKSIKATLGMRLNIAWFKIFADYSIQEYNTINAGIAFSFR